MPLKFQRMSNEDEENLDSDLPDDYEPILVPDVELDLEDGEVPMIDEEETE